MSAQAHYLSLYIKNEEYEVKRTITQMDFDSKENSE